MPLMAYDRFISQKGDTDPMLALFIRLMTLNKGLDLQNFIGSPQGFIGEREHFLPDPLWEVVDAARLRESSREYADHVFHLTCAVLAFAIVETLHCRIPSDRVRELIRLRMDLLRCGGASDSYKEENT